MAWLKTIVRGRLGTVEKFTCGISWGIIGPSPDAPDQDLVNVILAQLQNGTNSTNVPSGVRDLLSTDAAITGWRVEWRAEDETTLSVAEGLLSAELVGSGVRSKLPQDSMVISLRTATPGARGRGRLYWPALGATTDGSFNLSAPTRTQVITGFRSWLVAMTDQINAGFIASADPRRAVLSVRSPTDHLNRDVTNIMVGSIIDTQRRRRDEIPESYQSLVYPPP